MADRDPDAQRAIHRAARRTLQMVLRLLAHNAEHWLANQLNAYLQDPDEYRATTRNLFHLAGTITYTKTTIHVQLDQPATPRLARALNLLLQQINTTPPHIPGDTRPITYTPHHSMINLNNEPEPTSGGLCPTAPSDAGPRRRFRSSGQPAVKTVKAGREPAPSDPEISAVQSNTK